MSDISYGNVAGLYFDAILKVTTNIRVGINHTGWESAIIGFVNYGDHKLFSDHFILFENPKEKILLIMFCLRSKMPTNFESLEMSIQHQLLSDLLVSVS